MNTIASNGERTIHSSALVLYRVRLGFIFQQVDPMMTDNAASANSTMPNRVLPNWLVWWFPPLMLLVVIVVQLVAPDRVGDLMSKEEGIVEHATVAILIPGIVAGMLALGCCRKWPNLWLAGWNLAWVAAMIYFAGEEISWGQHYFGWETPETFSNLNDQGEMNLHNTTSWLDQKPRALVELWIIIGGIVIPIVRWIRREKLDHQQWDAWFWPTTACFVTAWCMVVSRIITEVVDATGSKSLDRFGSSELREYYIALFLTLYMVSIFVRMKRLQRA